MFNQQPSLRDISKYFAKHIFFSERSIRIADAQLSPSACLKNS